MPDSTTINYLDLMRSGKIPIKITEFQHYITPEDTTKYEPIAIDFDFTPIWRNGYRKEAQNSQNIQENSYSYRSYPTRIMDRIRYSGVLGALPTAYYNYRLSSNRNTNYVQ